MEEKKLIYYYFHDIAYNGNDFLVTFYFRDVLTGELVILNQVKEFNETQLLEQKTFYKDIEDAKKYYVILWDNNPNYIAPIHTSFEQVRKEYLNMINSGIEITTANNFMKYVHLGVSKSFD